MTAITIWINFAGEGEPLLFSSFSLQKPTEQKNNILIVNKLKYREFFKVLGFLKKIL